MKNLTLPLIAAVTASLSASSFGALFINAADISAAGPQSGYSGVVGVRFGVEANDIPAGQTVQVTNLGFFAGKPGQFTGAGVVDFSHSIALYGPRDYSSRAGDYSSLQVAEVTIAAGNAVDADGWSWVALGSPLDLVGGQYYSLVASMTAGQSADPYFDGYAGPGGTASLTAPNSIFYNGGSDNYMKGRYGLGNGEEAYDSDGYLAANFQYQVIPEASSAMALMVFSGLGLLRRRR